MSCINPTTLLAVASLLILSLAGCNDEQPGSSQTGDGSSASGGSGGAAHVESSKLSDSKGGVSSDPEDGQGGASTSLGGRQASEKKTSGGKATSGGATTGSTKTANGGASTTAGAAAGRSSSGGKSAVSPNTGGLSATSGSARTGGTTGSSQRASGGTASNTGGTSASATATTTSLDPTAPLTIWIAGDSTVQSCSGACPCGWGGPLATYFNSNVKVNNQAISGRSIQTWMYEPNVSSTVGSNGECTTQETDSTRLAAVVDGIKSGDYLFIQFGINDGDSACPRHVGSERYKALLTRLANVAIDKGAHPILMTATSMIRCSGANAVASRGFLTETKAVGTALDIPVIDLHALSITLYNERKFCPLPAGNSDISASTGGDVGAFFCNDHTHFDGPGALAIAGVVVHALRDQGIPLASALK